MQKVQLHYKDIIKICKLKWLFSYNGKRFTYSFSIYIYIQYCFFNCLCFFMFETSESKKKGLQVETRFFGTCWDSSYTCTHLKHDQSATSKLRYMEKKKRQTTKKSMYCYIMILWKNILSFLFVWIVWIHPH